MINVIKYLFVAVALLFLQFAFSYEFCEEVKRNMKIGETLLVSCDDACSLCDQVTYLGGNQCNLRERSINSEKEVGECKALRQEKNTEGERYPVEKNRDGRTAFLQSCLGANSEKYLHLLESYIDVNESDNGGNTCLHLLAYGGWWNQMLTIQKNGGDVTLENNNGETPRDILYRVLMQDKNDARIFKEFVL